MTESQDLDQLLSRIREEAQRQVPPAERVPLNLGDLIQRVEQLAVPPATCLLDYYVGDDEIFLSQAYLGLLGRMPDTSGLRSFLSALQRGERTRLDVLKNLVESQEGRQKQASLPELHGYSAWPGIQAWLLRRRVSAWMEPFLGGLLEKFLTRRALAPSRLSALVQQRGQAVSEILQQLLRHLASVQFEARVQAAEQNAEENCQIMLGLRQDLAQHQHALRRLMQDWEGDGGSPSVARQHVGDALDAYYLAFEHAYRGGEDAIAVAQSIYLPDMRDSAATHLPILDIGCGRGEWLTLLQEHGYRVLGLDLNPAMVEYCQARGLEVVRQDALSYLRQQPNSSLGAITGFHIVEHIPFPLVFDLVGEALRVLAPGGKLVLETPNPENVVVGASAFYNDPTHLNPLPPRPLEFLARYHGFEPVEVRRLHPYPMEQYLKGESEVENFLNYHFHGPQDYALIATKGGK